ncbi:hypothetical protein [Actinoplanes sp. GCM10030250]|uniref:hypothetical protein n=1 Tax=Actinoplanes sp. GCM10030250 TaxID=3273376 RepID=UPI003610F9FE
MKDVFLRLFPLQEFLACQKLNARELAGVPMSIAHIAVLSAALVALLILPCAVVILSNADLRSSWAALRAVIAHPMRETILVRRSRSSKLEELERAMAADDAHQHSHLAQGHGDPE